MWRTLRDWLSGLALLRHPELIRDLGERKNHLATIHAIRAMASNIRVSNNIILNGFQADRLLLEDNVTICDGTILSFGDALNGVGCISISASTWIGQYNNIRAGGGDITIGVGCLISQFCTLVASNHGTIRGIPVKEQPPSGKRGVTLKDDVWLCAGVTVTPGVTIHRGAIIGAGSLVTRDIPEDQIWAGIPARKIGTRVDEKIE